MAGRSLLVAVALLLVVAGVGLGVAGINSDAATATGEEDSIAVQGLAVEQTSETAGTPEPTDHTPAEQAGTNATATNQTADTQTVRLPTGETVAVEHNRTGGDGPANVSVADGDVQVLDVGQTTYALPTDRDPALDRSLFDVGTLLELEDTDALPVLIETTASASTIDGDGIEVTRELNATGAVAASIDRDDAAGVLANLIEQSAVDRIALDQQVDGPAVRAWDDGSVEQSLNGIAPAATDAPANDTTTTDGEGITVAIVDTGIDRTHPDLEDRVVDRIDLLDDDAEGDPGGHGTAVAGILAGEGVADERSYEGVAPGVDVIDIRAMGAAGAGQSSNVVEAIERVVEDTDADILVLSAAVGSSAELRETTEWAADQGLTVVSSAGNTGEPRDIDAAGTVEETITVGAYDHETGHVADFSSRGPTLDGRVKPDVLARGTAVPAPASGQVEDRPYRRMTGTSAAAPIVAGTVARLLATDPDLDPAAIRSRLASTATPVPSATVYEQGGGRVNPDRALDPDLTVTPGTVSIGGTAGDRERTLTVTNHGDHPQEIEFEPELDAVAADVDTGAAVESPLSVTEAIELNRTSVRVAPDETEAVSLRVAELPPGTYSGALAYHVGGERRSVAIGVVDGGEVTVEREPLPGAESDPDDGELLVFNEDRTHEEIVGFENGTASFFAAGGTYNLWSTRSDDETGTTIFVTDRRTFEGPETVVLNERETVPVGPETRGLKHQFGSLTAFSKTVSMSDSAGGRSVRWDVSHQRAASAAVRVTPEHGGKLAINALLVPDRQRPSDAPLAAPDVFHLAWGTDRVTGDQPYVSPTSLASARVTYGRQRADEELTVQHRAAPANARLHQQRRDWSLAGIDTQRLHRFAAGDVDYDLRVTGDVGTAVATTTPEHGDPSPLAIGKTTAASGGGTLLPANPQVRGSQPYHGGLTIDDWEDGVALAVEPMRDSFGATLDAANGAAELIVDHGSHQTTREPAWPQDTVSVPSVAPGDDARISLTATVPNATLSTRTLTAFDIDGYSPDRQPPATVTEFGFTDSDTTGAVSGASATLRVDGKRFSQIVDRQLWYAVGTPEAPPWEDPSAWNEVETERDGRAVVGDVPLASHDLPTAQESEPLAIDDTAFDDRPAVLSVAAAVETIDGHRTRAVTERAAHVGSAPDDRTVDIGAQLRTDSGNPVANATVLVVDEDGTIHGLDSPESDGSIVFSVEAGKEYQIAMRAGLPDEQPELLPSAAMPATSPIDAVNGTDDRWLGEIALPDPDPLSISVHDQFGSPVENATVRVEHDEEPAPEISGETDEHGTTVFEAGGDSIALSGPVEVHVEPPDGDQQFDGAVQDRVVVDAPTDHEVELPFSPPEAVLSASEPVVEAGERVELSAAESETVTDTATYQWDLAGDGEIDRETASPNRSVTIATTGERTIAVTVVDEAGNEATAAVTVEIREAEETARRSAPDRRGYASAA